MGILASQSSSCKSFVVERGAHPSCHDWIDISGIAERQSHEVGVQRSDSLEYQSDETCRREVQELWGGVICTWSAIDQRGVDLQGAKQVRKGEQQRS